MDKTQDPNKLFNMRLGEGEAKLRIMLSQKATAKIVAEEEGGGSLKKYGAKRRRRPEDEHIPRKLAGLINFYDMGQVKDMDDNWVDIDFGVLEAGDVVLGNQTVDPHAIFNHPVLSDFNDYRDFLLTPPSSTWKTHYRKLDYELAENYAIDLVDPEILAIVNVYFVGRTGSRLDNITYSTPITGDKWTTNGLKIKAGDWSIGPSHFTFGTPFCFWLFGDNPDCKITALPDYSEAAVSFSLDKPTDFFLPPRLVAVALRKTYANPNGPTVNMLITPYRPLSRQLYLEMVDAGLTYPFLTRDDPFAGMTLDSTNSNLIESHYLADPLSRGFFRESTSPGDVTFELSEVTDTDYDELQIEDPSGQIQGPNIILKNVHLNDRPAGILLAVAQQGSSLFYFWSDNSADADMNSYRLVTLTP